MSVECLECKKKIELKGTPVKRFVILCPYCNINFYVDICPNCLSAINKSERRYCEPCKTKMCRYCLCDCERKKDAKLMV